ncbi:MAG: FtsW/RodA/SpoVE family cell cycle protein [Anaerolineaceae bacterium]|nr:FtsW/RodA/SpoVE family cell cycle protein [Anaerolineaceae bacterium]
MNFLFPISDQTVDKIQSRLLRWASLALFALSMVYTLSPAVRLHSFETAINWKHWGGFVIWITLFAILHRLSVFYLPDRDPFLLPITGLLSGWGMLTIWRLDSFLGLKQAIWLIICGFAVWLIIRKTDFLYILRRYKYIWLVSGLLLTSLTLIFGVHPSGDGPRLWLGCCGIFLQPSEPLKLLMLVYIAAYLADRLPFKSDLIKLLSPTLIIITIALIILIAQRDLGTASIFILVYFFTLFQASGKRRILIFGVLSIVITALIGFFLFDIIQLRVNTWLYPFSDPSGGSFQIIQSMIALASGKLLGHGIGIGNPGLVPISYSDFIFTSIGEEAGLTGTIAIILLLAIFIQRATMIALNAASNYQRILAASISAYLGIQSIVIIGGNIGLLPLTGVTLPFVSYGGSSLLTSFVCLALLLMISNQKEKEPAVLPNADPYLFFLVIIFASFSILALYNSRWSLFESDRLLSRPDNYRLNISERYVPRGKLLDRQNVEIVISSGKPGSYERDMLQPSLSPVIGYSNPQYGQTSLEASLDPYLRGLKGNPSSTILYNQIVYGQSPPGLDIRLSIDLDIQLEADKLMQGSKGALVLMNAQTGEILAMSSHPYFNPNEINEYWEDWINDPDAPLLNRATQGQYPPGSSIGAFLLTDYFKESDLPILPQTLNLDDGNIVWNCTKAPESDPDWAYAISTGCPAAITGLGSRLFTVELSNLFREIGFYTTPETPLPVSEAVVEESITSLEQFILGQEILVSPLQMVSAASILSSNGYMPAPVIVLAVDTQSQGWVILSNVNGEQVFSSSAINYTIETLSQSHAPIWQTTAFAQAGDDFYTWFIGGTNQRWKGSPIAIALILEENNPEKAEEIGTTILDTILFPD